MKKLLLSLILLVGSSAIFAQTNLQMHYDLGKNRDYLTTTIEMFKTDNWGSTYFFIDYDYDYGENNHPSLSYFEISRALKFWQGPVSAHVEYNGGLGNSDNFGFSINNAYLLGANYDIHNADFSKTFTIELLYKFIQGEGLVHAQNTAQMTAVWGLDFFNGKISFDGYADASIEDKILDNKFKKDQFVFMTEPQLWYNFTKNLSMGTEIEISTNMYDTDIDINPTVAIKWNF